MYNENSGVKIKRAVWQLGLWHKLLEWAVPSPRNVAYQKNKKISWKVFNWSTIIGE